MAWCRFAAADTESTWRRTPGCWLLMCKGPNRVRSKPDKLGRPNDSLRPSQQKSWWFMRLSMASRIARIWFNRPGAHNAQDRTLLVQPDEACCRTEADDAVRVVILAARGRNLSAGHDLGSDVALLERKPGPMQQCDLPFTRRHPRCDRREDLSAGGALLILKHLSLALSA